MILISLNLENFKRYKSKSIEFGQGLVGIIGKNGTGKSSIFEAILFALYGEMKQRGWKESIRNAYVTTKDVVSCELIFEFEGIEYKIVREFRGKNLSANAKLYKNEELQVSGAREVTNSVIALTKMSKDAFMHTLFASQKELTSLSSLNNENRKKMIRKLLGLEKIDFVEGVLKDKILDLKKDIKFSAGNLISSDELKDKQEDKEKNILQKDEFEKEIVLKNKELKELLEQVRVIKVELSKLQEVKDKKQKLFSSLEILKNSINSNKTNQDKLTLDLQELEKKKSELREKEGVKKEFQLLEKELKEQEKLKEYYLKKEGLQKEQVQLTAQWNKTKQDIKRLENESVLYEVRVCELKKVDDAIKGLKQDISKEHSSKSNLQTLIGGEQKLINDTNKKIIKIENLGAQSSCPTCTRPLLDEYDNVLNSLTAIVRNTQNQKINTLTLELKQIEKNINDKEFQKSAEEKNFQEISQNINLIESKKKDLGFAKEHLQKVVKQGTQNKQDLEKLDIYIYDEDKHRVLKEKQNELKSRYEYVLSLETMLKRFDTLTLELNKITTTITNQQKEYQTKEKDYTSITYDPKLHKQKQELYDLSIDKKDKQTKHINDTMINIASIVGEIKAIQVLLDNNDKQLKKVETKKDDLQDYEKIKVSLSEFKTKINSKVAPRISTVASNMYATITKGKYQHIEVSNDFDFYIYDDGKKYPIERFSGGEIDLANLVLRIAISKTLAELNGASSIGFLAFDEVFGSQDESRRMEILEAFHTIKEQYRQIFLISHEMDIKEMFESVVEL